MKIVELQVNQQEIIAAAVVRIQIAIEEIPLFQTLSGRVRCAISVCA